MQIGIVVRSLREQRGLSQSELAERAGLQQSYLSRLEGQSRETRVDVVALDRIARVLEMTVDEILVMAHIRPSRNLQNDIRWKQMERLFRALPEERQADLVAIAETLKGLTPPTSAKIIPPQPPPTEDREDQNAEK